MQPVAVRTSARAAVAVAPCVTEMKRGGGGSMGVANSTP